MRSSVTAIIVTYNSAAVIGLCLDALYSNAPISLDVVVVDNASSDTTVELISSKYPDVRIIESSENLGFARAVNMGARRAKGEYIALINPDAVVTSESLAILISIQKSRSVPSLIAPRIVQPQGRLRIVSAGYFPSAWRMFCHYAGLSRLSSRRFFEGHYLLENRLQELQSVDWVTGAVWVLPSSTWRRLDGLSERWFMYAEDVEFCWRVRANGLEVLLARDVTATHLVGGSSGEVQSSRADWVINLYDFYCTSMSSSSVQRALWKYVVVGGLHLRSVTYRLWAFRVDEPGKKCLWLGESKRFSTFAKELMKVQA